MSVAGYEKIGRGIGQGKIWSVTEDDMKLLLGCHLDCWVKRVGKTEGCDR
jgi:hypothetical protein